MLKFYDGLSAKAPWSVARIFGEADIEDFLSIREQDEPQDTFGQLVKALQGNGTR